MIMLVSMLMLMSLDRKDIRFDHSMLSLGRGLLCSHIDLQHKYFPMLS